jgi:hypothetical protein
MSLIGGIVAVRRHAVAWFGGLALSAQAGIVIAAFVTVSAGVVIGAPYTPSRAPWLPPAVAPYRTAQSPSPLKPFVVEAVTPNDASPTIQPTSALTTATVAETGTRIATTMAPASTTAAPQATKASKATTAPQTTSSVYYMNCAQASTAGVAPITIGQPGYRTGLDPNGNGVAC